MNKDEEIDNLERISELFEQLNIGRICDEINHDNLRGFLDTWKNQMGREIDKIIATM